MTQDHNSKTAAPDDAGLRSMTVRLLMVRVLPIFCPIPAMAILPRLVLPLENPAGQADPVAVEDALKSVHDPEIPVNIYDLGLIYDVERRQNGDVYVTMSLTAPGCPVAGEMPGQVARALAAVDGVGEVSVELVWSPPWTPERMSDDARLALDF